MSAAAPIAPTRDPIKVAKSATAPKIQAARPPSRRMPPSGRARSHARRPNAARPSAAVTLNVDRGDYPARASEHHRRQRHQQRAWLSAVPTEPAATAKEAIRTIRSVERCRRRWPLEERTGHRPRAERPEQEPVGERPAGDERSRHQAASGRSRRWQRSRTARRGPARPGCSATWQHSARLRPSRRPASRAAAGKRRARAASGPAPQSTRYS